jgi:hypothetical protein
MSCCQIRAVCMQEVFVYYSISTYLSEQMFEYKIHKSEYVNPETLTSIIHPGFAIYFGTEERPGIY